MYIFPWKVRNKYPMEFLSKCFQNNFKYQLKMFFFDGVLNFVNIFIYFKKDSLLFQFDIFDMFKHSSEFTSDTVSH